MLYTNAEKNTFCQEKSCKKMNSSFSSFYRYLGLCVCIFMRAEKGTELRIRIDRIRFQPVRKSQIQIFADRPDPNL